MINQIRPVTSTHDVAQNSVRENTRNFHHQIAPKEKKSIEIITVPNLGDQKNQKNVAITLDTKLVHKILSKVYSKVRITDIVTPKCLAKLVKRKPDLVFSGVKYFEFDGNQIWLSDVLDLNKICYIGSNHAALDCEHNKGVAKLLAKKAGIVTADYVVIKKSDESTHKTMGIAYPVFVKPVIGGDSIGIDDLSLVFNREPVSYTHLTLPTSDLV